MATTKEKENPAQRMMVLFGGNKKNYGTHGEPELDEGGVKWKIKTTATTLRGAVTVKIWEDHIAGKKPLGIVPIDEDSKCSFGSIDVDDYSLDHIELIKKIEDAKLPLVPCRSKSNGMHLFLFTMKPVDAATMQTVLRDIAASLGLGACEIFPKQSKLLTDRGEMGSWIIMPYYGGTFKGKLKLQHGLKKTGAEMTITEFIRTAEKARVEPDKLAEIRVKKPTAAKRAKTPFADGPPCLQHMVAQGPIGQGGQNNTLFHMGVYYKRAFPEDWKTKLEEANHKFMKPIHPTENMSSLIRSLEKTEYEYKCKDQPMCLHCDAMLCRTRKYGVGTGSTYPILTSLQKLETDPPVWFVGVEGKTIMASTDDLQNFMRFHKLCIEHTNKCFGILKQSVWLSLVSEALEKVETIEAPPEASLAGIFHEHLESFLTNRQKGTKIEDLLSGRPYEDEEEMQHYFRLQDLQRHLQRENVRDITRPQITARLRAIGGRPRQFNIKNKYSVNAWGVPVSAFMNGTPILDIPKIKEEDV